MKVMVHPNLGVEVSLEFLLLIENFKLNMQFNAPERSRSRMINFKNNSENRITGNQIYTKSDDISKIKLNEHALKNLTKHWNQAIEQLKQSRQYRSRQRSRANLELTGPIINISTNNNKPKLIRNKPKTKIQANFTRQYKAKKEREEMDQTMYKLMCKRDKIKHIKTLINVVKTDEAEGMSRPSQQLLPSKFFELIMQQT